MALQGFSKLPVYISQDEAIKVYESLSKTNFKMGQIKTKFNCSIVNRSLVQVLSLSESIKSNQIEGTQVTFSDFVEEKNKKNKSLEFIEVFNYQTALRQGAQKILSGSQISSELIKSLHKTIMLNSRGSNNTCGEFRTIQNFIGRTNKKEDAIFIPVKAEEIDEYMDNLISFINKINNPISNKKNNPSGKFELGYDSQPLIRTAIIHAQFESIHPFIDGNGRIGRILIALNLINEGMISEPIFFVSEELEKEKSRYYDLLNGVRGENPDWASWILFFLKACERMCDKLLSKLEQVDSLASEGLRKCETKIEKDVWFYTFSNPVAMVPEVSEYLEISPNTARKSLNELVEKELLYVEKYKKRNKKYRNYDLMRILSD